MAVDTDAERERPVERDRSGFDRFVRSESVQRVARDRWLHVGLLVSIALMCAPIVVALVISTKGQAELSGVPTLAPGTEAVDNYREVLVDYDMGLYMWNSFVMSIVVTVGKLAVSLLAVLAIVYYRFPLKNLAFLFILFTLMLPIPVRIVPLYDLMVDLGWTNSLWAITIPYLASATTVFILRQHFLSISDSLVETARLDGVGPLKFLVYVLIPMSKGVLAGVSVIMFIYAWNQYLWPLIVINESDRYVAQIGISYLRNVAETGQNPWHIVMAGALVVLVPPLLVLILFRRPLLETFGVQQK